MHAFKVGDLVYRNYSPVQCGRVVRVDRGAEYEKFPGEFGPDTLFVRMLRGRKLSGGRRETLYKGSEFEFSDFRKLVEDTRRKADRHTATLEELERQAVLDNPADFAPWIAQP
jgi:hypothetical protein